MSKLSDRLNAARRLHSTKGSTLWLRDHLLRTALLEPIHWHHFDKSNRSEEKALKTLSAKKFIELDQKGGRYRLMLSPCWRALWEGFRAPSLVPEKETA